METTSRDTYQVSLKRTVFLPKGSPGICTIDSIYMQLRTKELSSSGGKIYGLGDIDILIQYLAQSEQEFKDGIYAPDRPDMQVGKTWQALLACPFEFLVDGRIECAPLWKLETGTVEWFMVTPRVLEMNFEVLILPPTESDLVFSRAGRDAASSVDAVFAWKDDQKGAVNKLSNIKEWKKENMEDNTVEAESTENIAAENVENMENAENIAAQETKSTQEKQTQATKKAENVAGESTKSVSPESADKWQRVSGKTTDNNENVVAESTTKKESVSPATTVKAESISSRKKESVLAAENQQANVSAETTKSETVAANENLAAQTTENTEAQTVENVEAVEENKEQENVASESTKAAKGKSKKMEAASENEAAVESEVKSKKTKSSVKSAKKAKDATLAQTTAKQATKSTQAIRAGKLSFYRVQEGDDLVSVAMRTGVPLDALISRNQLTGGEIMPGMLLIIPR